MLRRRGPIRVPLFRDVQRGRRAADEDDDDHPVEPPVADRQELVLSSQEPLRLRTRTAGVFLFLPLLAELGFDVLVRQAGYPGTKMVPADAALLSLLALKLLRKERLSHIDDYNLDLALGLFAGLNVLPKKLFVTDYSYRTTRENQQQLLGGWVKKLSRLLLPEAKSFSLDFHPIPYRGEDAILENHYVPCRGQASPSIQSFFAQEHENQVFCYANANLTRDEQSQEVIRFVDYWKGLTGHNPEWLYFDSKLTTYEELSELASREINFLTNDEETSPRAIVMNYARRNGVEDGLGTNVDFFHMDNVSSEVRLNVDLDVTLTVIANGCYRWLAKRLKGFEKAKPKQLSRKFVETAGTIEVEPNRRLRVTFDRRSHNPILREAALDKDSRTIAWWKRHRIDFDYR